MHIQSQFWDLNWKHRQFSSTVLLKLEWIIVSQVIIQQNNIFYDSAMVKSLYFNKTMPFESENLSVNKV